MDHTTRYCAFIIAGDRWRLRERCNTCCQLAPKSILRFSPTHTFGQVANQVTLKCWLHRKRDLGFVRLELSG